MANSNTTTTQSSGGGIGIGGLLGVAFVVLKLTHVIAWGWLWVLAPFWIPWAIVILILLMMFAFALIFD